MMKPIKKNILTVRTSLSHAASQPAEASCTTRHPVQTEFICRCIEIPPRPEPDALFPGTGDMSSTPPSSCSPAFDRNQAEIEIFVRRVIRAVEENNAAGVLFEFPFASDDTLAYILTAIGQKSEVAVGITRVIRNRRDTFAMPEKITTLPALKLIQWHVHCPEAPLETKPLWRISKQGVWNHFFIYQGSSSLEKSPFLTFIAANPNIAHSRKGVTVPTAKSPESTEKNPATLCLASPYDTVKNIPGIPLWQAIDRPDRLLAYLCRHSQKELFLMRLDRKKNTIFSLGRDIIFHFAPPDDLPPGYLDEICKMVEAGGSVAIKWLRYNLERAYLIAYAVENGVIVGNSSLKRPRKPFIERINKISGMDFTHFLERGYTSVRPEYRALGVGAKLLEGLTARAGEHKIFSIISEDNKATQKIAIRNKTRKVVSYYSEQMGKDAGIWMPESMIDDKD